MYHTDARDFARLGKLYLNNGNWNGKQIIPEDYVKSSITPCMIAKDGKPANHYGYQWWLIPNYKNNDIFYARGILGQFIIVIPKKNIIIVRLGQVRGEIVDGTEHHEITFAMIDDVLSKY